MTGTLRETTWRGSQLCAAIDALVAHSDLPLPTGQRASVPPRPGVIHPGNVASWVQRLTQPLGFEAVAVESSYSQAEAMLQRAAPAILTIHPEQTPTSAATMALNGGLASSGDTELRYLLLVGGSRRTLQVLAPDHTVVQVPNGAVRDLLCRPLETPVEPEVQRVLAVMGLSGKRQARARQALFGQVLGEKLVQGCWLIQLSGQAPVREQIRESRLTPTFGLLMGSHFCEYVLWIASWWVIGRFTLQGRFDPGWLLAWGLLLLSIIPFRLLTTYLGGALSIRMGAVLKRRLLHSTLRLRADDVRQLGTGQLLGRVMEMDVVEMMALTGGFLAVTALVELVVAGLVFALAAQSVVHVLLLIVMVGLVVPCSLQLYQRTRKWTLERMTMTNDLVERMIGHRTRVAQEAPAQWNAGEDQRLEVYLHTSRNLDQLMVRLQTLLPRGWLVLAILGLAPWFIAPDAATVQLAVGVGGALLAYRAFRSFIEGAHRLAVAAVAAGQLAPFWRTASRPTSPGHPQVAQTLDRTEGDMDEGTPLLEAWNLLFHYDEKQRPLLHDVSFTVRRGDRILLEGESGSGKSTLAALLAGGRTPSSGLLLLRGYDQPSLGLDGWRHRIVLVPQFHENHVLIGTFAFNVLLGRGWPPTPMDLQEAEQVCRALGLGPLIDRMPSGMFQMVGETGWQLSHGEKSRVYLARALLQQADLLVLDESFGALDPSTMRRSLEYVLQSTPTFVAIAHP